MVVALWFPEIKDFNLYCKLMDLRKEEIIEIMNNRGNIILVTGRDFSEEKKWEIVKSDFFKKLKPVNSQKDEA